MNQGKEPTVGQICDAAGINRSTFYRHYVDVYDLMASMEQEFKHGLFQSIQGDRTILSRLAGDASVLESLIDYIGKNPQFYRVYLQNHETLPLSEEFRRYWETQVAPLFRACGVNQESRMRYYYSFFKAGLLSVLRLWLENGCVETPSELSQVIAKMLPARSDLPASESNASNEG
ncbi:MAG: TetR family transcriptional regulator C-terminal domain-containing protein [Oscillospiraceae bacterium]|nr:TetR family transcriptional regulator C-terminal domain-containing protein [Oscillospiraceae bacterium]